MNFIQLLILAHIVGDFPLQTDAIYRVKQKSFGGMILHVAVCTIVNIIFLFPFLLSYATWLAILFLALFHFTLDRMKILLTIFKAKDGLGYFLIDQFIHFLSLFITSVWLQRMYTGSIALEQTRIELIIALTAILAAAFVVPPILFYIQKNVKHFYRLDINFSFPSEHERLPGSIARFFATLGLILGGWYFLFFIAAIVIPWIAPQNRSRASVYRRSELVVNVLACLLGGAYVYILRLQGY